MGENETNNRVNCECGARLIRKEELSVMFACCEKNCGKNYRIDEVDENQLLEDYDKTKKEGLKKLEEEERRYVYLFLAGGFTIVGDAIDEDDKFIKLRRACMIVEKKYKDPKGQLRIVSTFQPFWSEEVIDGIVTVNKERVLIMGPAVGGVELNVHKAYELMEKDKSGDPKIEIANVGPEGEKKLKNGAKR